MTALLGGRATPSRPGQLVPLAVAGGVTIHQGALVVINAAGFACPGKTAVNLVVAGAAEEGVSTVGLADGAATVTVRRGLLFRWANHPADQVTQASIGRACYVVDDQTVAGTHGGNTRSAAGTVLGIDAAGVWVAS